TPRGPGMPWCPARCTGRSGTFRWSTRSICALARPGWVVAGARGGHGAPAAQGTPREAEDTARREGRRPYSRSRCDRVGHAVGQRSTAQKPAIDDALIVALDIPAKAQSVSVGMDRVSLPLEEPRPRPVGCPRTDARKRPASRVVRRASGTTSTFHDETGPALPTIRPGAGPSADPLDLYDRLLADAIAILGPRPDVRVVLLPDGAPALRDLLPSPLDEA